MLVGAKITSLPKVIWEEGRVAALSYTYAVKSPTDRPTDARTYVRTDRPTDRPRESLTTIGRCATRATRPNNNNSVNSLTVCEFPS